MQLPRDTDILVIGGGIWGWSAAYHLAELGCARQTLVLERNAEIVQETTSQSAGQVGQLRGDAVLANAVGYTLELLAGFRERTGHDPGFVRSGSLHVALCAERAAMFARLAETARGLGVVVEAVDHAEAARLAPTLRLDDVHASLWVPRDGHVSAPATARAFASAARDAGVSLATGVEVVELLVEHGRATGVRVIDHNGSAAEAKTIRAERIVLTAGPWTVLLAPTAGFSPPFFPIRLQQARTESVGLPDSYPVLRVPDTSCYIRPERGGYLHGFFDPDPLPIDLHERGAAWRTRDVTPEPLLIAEMQRRLAGVLPQLAELKIDEYRQGMITCTPDGRFAIGAVPGVERLWMAGGCGGTGIAASGAIGRWLANLAVNGHAGDDIGVYDPGRFAKQPEDKEWLRRSACQTSAAYYRLPSEVK